MRRRDCGTGSAPAGGFRKPAPGEPDQRRPPGTTARVPVQRGLGSAVRKSGRADERQVRSKIAGVGRRGALKIKILECFGAPRPLDCSSLNQRDARPRTGEGRRVRAFPSPQGRAESLRRSEPGWGRTRSKRRDPTRLGPSPESALPCGEGKRRPQTKKPRLVAGARRTSGVQPPPPQRGKEPPALRADSCGRGRSRPARAGSACRRSRGRSWWTKPPRPCRR